ncbi:MAG: TrmH family RNA methyltransferase, partial [Pseudomonadota bacterium]
MPLRLALYQPDIPQNAGTLMRMGACLGIPLDVIGPTGFDMRERALRRAGMDYLATADVTRHGSWERFVAALHAQQFALREQQRRGLPPPFGGRLRGVGQRGHA